MSSTGGRIAIVLALVVVGALAVSILKSRPQVSQTVSIANCVATPNSVTLHYANGDQVQWMGDGQTYNLVFASSPFSAANFAVTGAQAVSSGPISTAAKTCALLAYFSGGCSYKYTITSSNNSCSQDPIVVVQK